MTAAVELDIIHGSTKLSVYPGLTLVYLRKKIAKCSAGERSDAGEYLTICPVSCIMLLLSVISTSDEAVENFCNPVPPKHGIFL